jgi:tRNA (guanine37-N1)-methyltransferase
VRIDVFTLFPEMFAGPLSASMMGRAQECGALSVALHNFRDYATDKHKSVDDTPYGGDGGMVLRPEPIICAVEDVLGAPPSAPVILLSPQGRVFSQAIAGELAALPGFGLICGHYEGADERVRELIVTDELSIGDYVLTGGELAALVVIDAVARLLPGVLGDPDAPDKDSHATGLLEHPHYTRPAVFRDLEVPEVLRSGSAAQIARWRREESLRRTWQRRPDLLLKAPLTAQDADFLAELADQSARSRRKS